MDGSYNRTSIELHGIANIDGELRFTPDEPGNFQNTCQHIHVRDDILTASCRRIDGSYNNTSIPIPGITNENGDLRSNW